MKIEDLPQKRWFSWSIVALLLLANIASYKMTDSYFKKVNPAVTEEVDISSNILGGNRVIDWARDILRFFKNP